MEIERRFLTEKVELRGDDKTPVIRGYAAVFDQESEDLGGFREIIRKGAFAKTIKEADVRALFNHDNNFVLGRTKNGTLKLFEDDHGLGYEITPPDTTSARDTFALIKRGDVDQSSFGFRVIQDKWNDMDDDKKRTRELLEVRLFDVSPVTFPAYPQTDANVRALIDKARSEPGQAAHSEQDKAKPDQAVHFVETRRRLHKHD